MFAQYYAVVMESMEVANAIVWRAGKARNAMSTRLTVSTQPVQETANVGKESAFVPKAGAGIVVRNVSL